MKTVYDIEYRDLSIREIRNDYYQGLEEDPYQALRNAEELLGYFLDLRSAHQRWSGRDHTELERALFRSSELVTPQGFRKRCSKAGLELNNLIQHLDYNSITHIFAEEDVFMPGPELYRQQESALETVLDYMQSEFRFGSENQRNQLFVFAERDSAEDLQEVLESLSSKWWQTLCPLPYRLQELADAYENLFYESEDGLIPNGGFSFENIVSGCIGATLILTGTLLATTGIASKLGVGMAVNGASRLVEVGIIESRGGYFDPIDTPDWESFARENIENLFSQNEVLAIYPISRNLTTLFTQEGFLIPKSHSHTLPDGIAVYAPKFGGVGLVGRVEGVIKPDTGDPHERAKLERTKNMVNYKVGRAMLKVRNKDKFRLASVLPTPSPVNTMIETSVQDFRTAGKIDDLI